MEYRDIKTLPELAEFMRGQKVTVVGAGISNAPLIEMLGDMGAELTIRDGAERHKLPQRIQSVSAVFVCGESYLEGLEGLIFKSPGVKLLQPAFETAMERGAVVTSEMELFFMLCPCKIIAITGSDGKTTTTTLISKLLEADGRTVHLGGNIGTPLLPRVGEMKPCDIAVIELSSFQLQSMNTSRACDTAVVTNITPNHLDYHKSMQEYIDAKTVIFANQSCEHRLILNANNDITASFAETAKSSAELFSLESKPDGIGMYLRDGIIVRTTPDGDEELLDTSELLLPGIHNTANFMAALSAVYPYIGNPARAAHEVATTFKGVENRMELVLEQSDGVRYYNSSIDSSPTRTAAGLSGFKPSQPLIAIMGGYDKNLSNEPLIPVLFSQNVKNAVLTGTTGIKLRRDIEAHPEYASGKMKVIYEPLFDNAVRFAIELAAAGDYVVLSPASASFNAFKNFEERGRRFKELVLE